MTRPTHTRQDAPKPPLSRSHNCARRRCPRVAMQDVSRFPYAVMAAFSSLFVAFGLLQGAPAEIAKGLCAIICSSDVLITDYVALGGIGAAFVNAGLLMLAATALLWKLGVPFRGLTVAAVFLTGSFGLFGKNIFNVWPVLTGTWLYARVRGEPFSFHAHTALFATCLSPVVSEVAFAMPLPPWLGLLLGCLLGVSIGFLIPPLALHMKAIHMGFSLYNVGFTAGMLGTVYVSLFKSYGYQIVSRLIWSEGNNSLFLVFLGTLFGLAILLGLWLTKSPLAELKGIFSSTGRFESDFIQPYGFGASLINIGLNGLVATGYVLFVGGPLNGPTIGGILTVAGFGACGKHASNILPIFLGVILGGLTKVWSLNDPAPLLAALFGTSLAPIAGYYGWAWGVAAGFINSSVALNSGVLHGGMNLYNTGFSAGIVAAFLVPLMDSLAKRKRPKGARQE